MMLFTESKNPYDLEILLIFVGPNGYRPYSCFYFVHINFLQTLRTLLSNFPSFPPSSSLVLPCQCNLFLSPLKADSFFLSSIPFFPFKPRVRNLSTPLMDMMAIDMLDIDLADMDMVDIVDMGMVNMDMVD